MILLCVTKYIPKVVPFPIFFFGRLLVRCTQAHYFWLILILELLKFCKANVVFPFDLTMKSFHLWLETSPLPLLSILLRRQHSHWLGFKAHQSLLHLNFGFAFYLQLFLQFSKSFLVFIRFNIFKSGFTCAFLYLYLMGYPLEIHQLSLQLLLKLHLGSYSCKEDRSRWQIHLAWPKRVASVQTWAWPTQVKERKNKITKIIL